MRLDVLQRVVCLVLAPVHVGLAATLSHPQFDGGGSAGILYSVAGGWFVLGCRTFPRGWRWKRLYALPMAGLLLAHLWSHGALEDAGRAAAEAVSPAKVPRRFLGVPAPRAAPPFAPDIRPGGVARSAAAVFRQSAVFALRVALGTPAWAWCLSMVVALCLSRKGGS